MTDTVYVAAAHLRAAVLDRQHESEVKHTFPRYAHLPKRGQHSQRSGLRDSAAVSCVWGVWGDDTLLLSYNSSSLQNSAIRTRQQEASTLVCNHHSDPTPSLLVYSGS